MTNNPIFYHTDIPNGATDTGLETVGYVTQEWLAKHCSSHTINAEPSPAWSEAVVTRSQAVELLVAKDAELEAAREHGDMWFKDYSDLRETFKLSEIERRKLEADNAAQAARIKELEVNYSNMETQLAKEVLQVEALKETIRDDIIFIKDQNAKIEDLKYKLRMSPQSNMWLQEDGLEKFKRFVMEKGILEGLWEISNMLGGYVDDGTPKPEADYMLKTQLYVDVLTRFYRIENINEQIHREAREAIRIKRHFKEQSE